MAPGGHVPRLLLLNSADGEVVRAVAETTRTWWSAIVFDAEAQAVLLQRGMPGYALNEHAEAVTAVGRHAAVQVGATLAHRFGPFVVVPATIPRRKDVSEMEHSLEGRQVRFGHIVLDSSPANLAADRSLAAAGELLALHAADAHLDVAALAAADPLASFVPLFIDMGWLRQDRHWAAGPPGRPHA
jgi:hypothetical protein